MAADTNPEDLQGGAHPGGTPDDKYERSDARVNAVLVTTIFIFVVAVLIAAGVLFYYRFAVKARELAYERRRQPLEQVTVPTEFQGPNNLQVSTKKDMEIYREESYSRLNTYGWVSKEAGVVRIPIERAMALVVERGLPTRPTNASVAFADQATSYPQQSSSGRTYRNAIR